MFDHSNPIISFFLEYAYEPAYVYLAIVILLVASSFGLPFPEEATLLSAGLLAHIGSHPELYPPPSPDANGVSVGLTAAICFFAVFLSDLLVFTLGRYLGPQLLKNRLVQYLLKPQLVDRINHFTIKYGAWACGIFRFTPGLRFPGHFACGSFGISYFKFILVDGTAALFTVPTQVILMAYFGEEVLSFFKNIKIAVGSLLVLVLAIHLFKRWRRKRRKEAHPSSDLTSQEQ